MLKTKTSFKKAKDVISFAFLFFHYLMSLLFLSKA